MNINGTLVNYFFHCKRQCYLHGNRLNLEDNSENVQIGKAIHEERALKGKETELQIDNIKLDRLTRDYLIEIKKSDADIEASRWQLIYYLAVLKSKGIIRKGRLEIVEKKKSNTSIEIIQLTEELEEQLNQYVAQIEQLVIGEDIPSVLNKGTCKKCAYYEYCYI